MSGAPDHEPLVPDPVADEERLLRVVLEAARRPNVPRWFRDEYDAELLRLRDELADARLPEDKASILEQMDRVSRLASQRAQHVRVRLDVGSPYFGHMRLLDDDEQTRDILIGKQTFVRDGVRIVDWRNAPISKVFYQRRAGEVFSLRIAGRLVEGEVEIRRTVTIRDGELLRVSSGEGTWVLAGGEWRDIAASLPVLGGGAESASRAERTRPVLGVGLSSQLRAGRVSESDKHLPEIASLLDPEQFELITRPDSGLCAIRGSAGSGKTTVALHRVAYLAFQDERRFDPSRTLVVVPSPALAAYISRVLPALGVTGVQVHTFEAWAREQRTKVAREMPDVYADDTPAAVTRLKLSPALLPMLAEGAREQPPDLAVPDLFDELFTNLGWLRQGVARHSPGQFTDAEVEAIHRWCSDQHFVRAEGGGPRDHDIPCLDPEDDAILLRLHQLRHGVLPAPRGRQLRYAHLVVDEVQDLCPIELAILLDAVPPGAPVTLAGDSAQKVMVDTDYDDWAQVLTALGHEHVRVSPLHVSYRSTASIMRLGRHVLGPLAPDEPVAAPREGPLPVLLQFPGRGEAMTVVADALETLVRSEPNASVAVLCRHPQNADAAYAALSRAEIPGLRRIADYDFPFEPGIDVSDIRQSKGLEFDYAVLLDVDQVTYPCDEQSRHLLHVGITRAAHQVWLVAVGPPSRLLPEWLCASAASF